MDPLSFKGTMARVHAHCTRVGYMALLLGSYMGLDSESQTALYIAGRYHDFGKLKIPLSILNKPGPLTSEEFEIMKDHPIHSTILVDVLQINQYLSAVILHHHENWDGSGYPNGLKAEAIPLGSRILAICDVFDALTENRVYRDGCTVKEAIDIMDCEERNNKFDSRIYLNFFRPNAEEVYDIVKRSNSYLHPNYTLHSGSADSNRQNLEWRTEIK